MIIVLCHGPFNAEHFELEREPGAIEIYYQQETIAIYTRSTRNQGLTDNVVFDFDGTEWVDSSWLDDTDGPFIRYVY